MYHLKKWKSQEIFLLEFFIDTNVNVNKSQQLSRTYEFQNYLIIISSGKNIIKPQSFFPRIIILSSFNFHYIIDVILCKKEMAAKSKQTVVNYMII